MSDVTGTLHHQFGGREYALRLTIGGIARLQAKHGADLGGLLTQTEDAAPKIPDFAVMLDIIQVALEKGGVAPDGSADLADDMLTADIELASRLLQAAFPAAAKGARGKAKAPRN